MRSSVLQRDAVRVGGVLLVAGVLGGLFWLLGLPHWREWKAEKALAQAEEFAARSDYRNAVLALRRATEATPGDARVWQEVATFLSRLGSPDAVLARENQAQLEPENVPLRMALVTEALRFRDVETARKGLERLEQAGREDLAFYRLAAAVALALGQMEEFETRLAQLVAADPGDASARFNLAALRAWSEDPGVARAAAIELESLQADPGLRLRVALERLKLAGATREPARVEREVREILGDLDPLARARLPQRPEPGEPQGWGALLKALENAAAAGGANDAALLARWLGDHGLGARALTWLESLPPDLRKAREPAAAAADLAARINDLARLRTLLSSGAWGPLPSETIDLALAARVQSARFGSARSRPTWEDAVSTARGSLTALRALVRLAGIWRDQEDSDRALQAIVDEFPREHWACEALRVSYATRRDTEKLWRLYQVWAPRVPENKQVQQTWVMLGVLLNRLSGAQRERIEALLAQEGAAPELATLLAATGARWRAGQTAGAEEVLARAEAMVRDEPRVRLWRAVLAAERDDAERLREATTGLERERLTREEQGVLADAVSEHEKRRRAAGRLPAEQEEAASSGGGAS